MTDSGAEKNRIYNRLVKSATNLLEWQNADIRVLDPIVALFFGACADEFDRLYQDINSYQSRILERLSSLLLPDVNKNPIPSHAVVFANPDSGKEIIDEDFQFFLKKNKPGAVGNFDNQIDIFYTPICSNEIFDIELKYSIAGNKIYKIENNFFRELIADLPVINQNQTSVWLGFKPGNDLENLSGLRLFFDWPSLKSNYRYSEFLSNCKISVNGMPLKTKNGLPDVLSNQESINSELIFEPTFDPLHFTTNFYNDKFISIQELDKEVLINSIRSLPGEFQQEKNIAQKFEKEKLVWIKIEFDATAPEEMIQELLVFANAFPVINRKLNDFTYRLQNNLNLVPIEPENDFFLAIENIVSGNGTPLKSAKSGSGSLQEGSYLLRRGGIDRFDSRDARSMLNHLIDLLRQENSAFKMLGYDTISQLLREMEQLINSLDQKVNKDETQIDESTYLFVKPLVANENLFVSFWSTNGAFANQLKVGTQLSVYNGSGLKQNQVTLCTNTLGGKDPLQASEALNVFKNALLTRERIVSRSDIRHFCKSAFGEMLKEVNLEEIFKPSKAKNKGFEKYVSVQIVLNNNPETDVESMAHAIKTKLQESSGVFLKYDVTVGYEGS
jgi:hypothetical protein